MDYIHCQNPVPDWKQFADSLKSELVTSLSKDLEKLKGKIMAASQADLDAAIAALPGLIDTALAPVIAAIQAKAPAVDFTSEIAALNAIPAAVATAVAPVAPPAGI